MRSVRAPAASRRAVRRRRPEAVHLPLPPRRHRHLQPRRGSASTTPAARCCRSPPTSGRCPGCATWRTPCSRRSSARSSAAVLADVRGARSRSGASPTREAGPARGDADRSPTDDKDAATVAAEAGAIAAYVQAEVAGKRRAYGDFLVLTRQKPQARRVRRGVRRARDSRRRSAAPALFCKSPEVQALALLLRALADPLDAVALVGVLRGPLFGLSDPELFQFRQAGGRFELTCRCRSAGREGEPRRSTRGSARCCRPCASSRRCWRLTRRLPLAAAVDADARAHRLAGSRLRRLPAALGPATCCRPSTRCARWWSRAAGWPMPPTRSPRRSSSRPRPRRCRSSRAGATSCAS